MSKCRFLFLCGVLAALNGSNVNAQEKQLPTFTLGQSELLQIVEEQVYPLTKQQYINSRPTPLPMGELQNKQTPEAAVISWLSFMAKLDVPHAKELWDKESQALMVRLYKAQNKDDAYWIRTWSEQIAGHSARFLYRLTIGQYVLIQYELLNSKGELTFKDTVAMRKEKDNWVLTLDLANTAAIAGWEKPNERVRKISDAALGYRVSSVPLSVNSIK